MNFSNISDIKKTDNILSSTNTNFNPNEIYSPKRIRTKTPLIHKPKMTHITKKKYIINHANINSTNGSLKPSVFNQTELFITKTENFDLKKENKKYISKTPIKVLGKKKEIIPKSRLKANLFNIGYDKSKIKEEINNIHKNIASIEKKIKSIEKSDKKSKQKYNLINNRYNNNQKNTINMKTIRNITPLIKQIKKTKKKNIRPQKTLDENNMKGYKDVMPTINKEKIEINNNIIFNNVYLKRNKSTDILLKKKKVKKVDKSQKYQNINNYIFGKQKYLNDNNYN